MKMENEDDKLDHRGNTAVVPTKCFWQDEILSNLKEGLICLVTKGKKKGGGHGCFLYHLTMCLPVSAGDL